ncbi:hypothetical protein NSU_3568 [Novosphingobium pentaromativorans US6-1]|uniref:4Fe-4S Mo/W bis-MGD-type domain-containing protein n=3 Tax=Novosphingobium pentaromativorans TaxID=205844 RepID=G6EGU7_9SPHN|nr:hypothetical protein NSU_3568 [Novosphingobium pentaromativorans US6-1]
MPNTTMPPRSDAEIEEPGIDRIVRTVCAPNCSGTCGVKAFVRDDRIVKLEPASYPDPRYERICLKGIAMATQRLHGPDRLSQPMIRAGARGEGKWREVSWEEAYAFLAEKLERIAAQYGPSANSWMSMTGNYSIKSSLAPMRIANQLEGTTFSNMGMMGDGNCPATMLAFLGVMSSAQRYEDHVGSKLIILVAKNVADTAHSEMHFLFEAMDAGAKLVAIDPRFSRTAAKADQWISIRPGTDTAMLMGMIAAIREGGLIDEPYVTANTNAPFLVRSDNGMFLRAGDLKEDGGNAYLVWDDESASIVPSREALRPRLRGAIEVSLRDGTTLGCRTAFDVQEADWDGFSIEEAADLCGLDADTIRQLGIEYARTDPATIILGQGVQRYFNGHTAFRAAMTLGALCGKIGKPHAGVHWMDGAMLQMVTALDFASQWVVPDGKVGGTLPGTRMMDIITSGHPHPVKSLWLTKYGFGTQAPLFKRFVKEVLPELDLFAVTEQVMTPAAEYADIVLPCVSFLEEELDIVGGGENFYVQLRQRAVPPVGQSRSDWEIFAGLMEHMGRGGPWRMSAEEVCEGILRDHGHPLIRAITLDQLREGPVEMALPTPYVPFQDLQFPTASGKMHIYQEELAEFGEATLVFKEPLEGHRSKLSRRYPLTLINSHHVHSVHSQHLGLGYIREQLPEPRLEIHPEDARQRGIADGDAVRVFNDRGHFKVRITVTEAMRRGSVNLPQGWKREDFIEGHHSDVMNLTINPAQDRLMESNFNFFDNLVEVEKA